jgi:putative ABC transport system substrate-binding protein
VGFLSIGVAPPPEESARYELFTSLSDLGWVAGQNIVFEFRFAEGQADRLPTLAAELVRLKVDVIVTLLNQETLAAKQASASIPVVMLFGVAPVETGLVASVSSATGTGWERTPWRAVQRAAWETVKGRSLGNERALT